jgi:apolipoprotein N-acyltransferase
MKGQVMRTRRKARPLEELSASVQPAAGPRIARLPLPCLLPALATGFLLWLCYFPVAWGWLGWVALVPLLCLVRSEARPRRVYFCAWAGGLLFFGLALRWVTVADYRMYGAWVLLAIYCALYVPVGIWLIRGLERRSRLPLVITLPAVWTGLEFLRSYLLSGFSWYYLGHTQHDFLAMIQIADLAGAYGVTFLVAAVNALVFEGLYRSRRLRAWLSLPAEAAPSGRWALPVQAAGLVAALVAVLAYGAYRLGEEDFARGPRVALLQSSIDQRLREWAAVSKDEAAVRANQKIRDIYEVLCRRARVEKPDLVVWPETSFPVEWVEVSPKLPTSETVTNRREWARYARRCAERLAAFCRSSVLLGTGTEVLDAEGETDRYNSAVLIRKEPGWPLPRYRPAGRYDKMHRVPFGEFVPFRETFPFMNALAPYDYDYSIRAGERQVRFELRAAGSDRPYHFGVLICYEDTDPYLARRLNLSDGDQPPADFLINISNDGWFDGTSEHEEHLAICRFRAIESRRAVARSVNMGVSAVIDSNGRVIRPDIQRAGGEDDVLYRWQVRDGTEEPDLPLGDWQWFKKVQGVLTATIPIDDRGSLYAQWGDWLPSGCWLIVAGGLFWGRFRSAKGPKSENPS